MAGALDGIRVLEISRWVAAPYCGQILGDMGADVVKVENLAGGDDSREVNPKIKGQSTYFMAMNRNKRGITLNFRHPKGQELLRRLAAKADVLIENFRPGTMAAMGCSYEILRGINPRLVMASISGYGQDGPYSQRACLDAVAQAKSGLQSMTGFPHGPPTLAGTFIADYTTALYASIGILLAIRHRDITGEGQLVDVALVDCAISMLLTAIPNYLALNIPVTRHGNRGLYQSPVNTFRTKDGWVQINAGSDAHFQKLTQAMGQSEMANDPLFNTQMMRMANVDALEKLITKWTTQLTADEAEAKLESAGVPAAKVSTIAEAVDNPQVRHREMIIAVEHGTAGSVPLPGIPNKLSASPGRIRRSSPLLGEHNEEIYGGWLGLSKAEIDALSEEKAI